MFSSSIFLSLLILLLKLDSLSLLRLKLSTKLTSKSIVILFSSSSLIVMPFTTSYIVYKRPFLLLSTSIVSKTLLLIIARFSSVLLSAFSQSLIVMFSKSCILRRWSLKLLIVRDRLMFLKHVIMASLCSK
jgi:hypothetical protein